MKTRAEKALHLCGEYDRLMSSIAKSKIDIGNGLANCDRIFTGPDGDYIPDGKQTHLAEAFTPFDDEDECGYLVQSYNPPEEIAEIIGDCEGCAKSYAAIQERKAARKALGIVKRQIRMIGRGATDEKA